jgi:cell division protein FtsL
MSPLRFSLLVLWSGVFASALGVVWSIHQTRTLFIELQSLNAERDRLDIEWSQLKIEQSAWTTHGRVESTARQSLNMVIPAPQEVQLVQP